MYALPDTSKKRSLVETRNNCYCHVHHPETLASGQLQKFIKQITSLSLRSVLNLWRRQWQWGRYFTTGEVCSAMLFDRIYPQYYKSGTISTILKKSPSIVDLFHEMEENIIMVLYAMKLYKWQCFKVPLELTPFKPLWFSEDWNY